ncbi:hypothetical protein F4801DRAFT_563050 [Xylaria longipes]|nr:hypothetical protein F4801DRAFT_563050 [Xylaria longipes]
MALAHLCPVQARGTFGTTAWLVILASIPRLPGREAKAVSLMCCPDETTSPIPRGFSGTESNRLRTLVSGCGVGRASYYKVHRGRLALWPRSACVLRNRLPRPDGQMWEGPRQMQARLGRTWCFLR